MKLSRVLCGLPVLAALAASTVAPATPVVAAPEQPRAAASSATAGVLVDGERVTVDVTNEDLSDVLAQLAEQVGFRLTSDADLGRVTASFTVGSVEQALRRLVHDHDLMLVYSPSPGDAGGTLTHVEVFASTASPRTSPRGAVVDATERAATLSEITALVRPSERGRAEPRLVQLLDTSSDPEVRARAAWALGHTAGALAAPALTRALRDSAATVRTQAISALRNVQGLQSIPAISGVLHGDPDARVRRTAARALGALGTAEAIEALRTSSGDPDPLVRRDVDRALRRRSATPPR
jgi:hypothetical protein